MVLEQVEIVERNGLKVVVKRFSDIQGLKKILEREYVEGVKLSDIDVLEAAEKLAKILASLHREG